MRVAALVAQVVGAIPVRTIIIVVVLALLLGPLRRPFFRYGRFTIPVVIGGAVGWALGAYMATLTGPSSTYSSYMPWFGTVAGVIVAVQEFKN